MNTLARGVRSTPVGSEEAPPAQTTPKTWKYPKGSHPQGSEKAPPTPDVVDHVQTDLPTPKRQTISVPAIGPSLNEFYAGQHWSYRRKIKQRFALLVSEVLDSHERVGPAIAPVTTYPVQLEVVCRFGPGRRRFDVDNCAVTAKLITDQLVRQEILLGDSPKYIEQVTLRCERTERPSHTRYTIVMP